ncbi:hypothetical protein CEY16_10530 [Halalkalibacillus sediminis]|uniref:Uncharacterized protein n=1 Tax=Halalkalibacillus sediminis TaxID=2018042 RepID=A0A2I0QS83_9BACI|nr:hypothetical protein [Halalkalibacillus sediminis]PKR77169.1 hypothetical protein CEY16_10530 [Halalkalibacillus sediminis]
MFHNVKANLYFMAKDTLNSIVIFWSIYLLFIAAFLLLASYTPNSTIMMTTVLPAVIFTVIFGIMLVKETFPYIIKLGSTRHTYFVSVLVYIILFAIVMTIISQTTTWGIMQLQQGLGVGNFEIFTFNGELEESLPLLSTLGYEMMIYSLILSSSLLIGMIFFRFGFLIGGLIFAVAIAMLFIEPILLNVGEFVINMNIFGPNYQPEYLAYVIGVTLILSWMIIRNASIVDQISKK